MMKKKKEVNMTEEQIQAKCFQWFWNTYPLQRQMLYHNNNNSVNRVAGNKMKAIGVVAGVSDFTYILHGCVVFIEMKTDVGQQKTEQKDFMNKVQSREHLYFIIRSFEAFCELIKKLNDGALGNS